MIPTGKPHELYWKYPATLQNVERISLAVVQVLDKIPLQKKDRFAVELLLREALNNAFFHGCQQNPLLSFSCRLEISGREVILEVSDEGAGFDWRRQSKSPPDTLNRSGRGLPIYAIYASSIEFNDAGNCVRLTRTIFTDPLLKPPHDDQGEKDG